MHVDRCGAYSGAVHVKLFPEISGSYERQALLRVVLGALLFILVLKSYTFFDSQRCSELDLSTHVCNVKGTLNCFHFTLCFEP